MAHYIAWAGFHGCMPTVIDVYHTYAEAVNGMCELVPTIGRRRKNELRKTGYLELHLHAGPPGPTECDGHEYCEIYPCECNTPWEHSEHMTQADWAEDDE